MLSAIRLQRRHRLCPSLNCSLEGGGKRTRVWFDIGLFGSSNVAGSLVTCGKRIALLSKEAKAMRSYVGCCIARRQSDLLFTVRHCFLPSDRMNMRRRKPRCAQVLSMVGVSNIFPAQAVRSRKVHDFVVALAFSRYRVCFSLEVCLSPPSVSCLFSLGCNDQIHITPVHFTVRFILDC